MSDIRRHFGSGRSPFDEIMHQDYDDGPEYWSGREMMPFLNYSQWRNFENVIQKAKVACRKSGHQVADHFADVSKMVDIGSGAQRVSVDVQMTRFGCYLVAMCGDPEKPGVAAAKQYFAVMTRAAELAVPVPDAIVAPVVLRPWSERFRETVEPHMRFMYMNHPGCFTVVTTLVGQMLCLEDELIRHLLKPQPSDRPDISIGLCWSNNRKIRGLPEVERFAPLQLPDQDREVLLCVYEDTERGTFEAWFGRTYLPEKLPEYLGRKPEYRPVGELPPASAADNTCKRLTGREAILKPRLRRQLVAVGGFFPVGAQLPAPEQRQRGLFDGMD